MDNSSDSDGSSATLSVDTMDVLSPRSDVMSPHSVDSGIETISMRDIEFSSEPKQSQSPPQIITIPKPQPASTINGKF